MRNPNLQYYVDGLGSAQQQFPNPITEGNQIVVRSGGTPMNGTSTVSYFVEACVSGNVTINGEIDADFDGIPSNKDNCPQVANASQINSFGDERGDGCDPNFYDNGNGVKGFVTNNVINLFGACRAQRCSPVGTIRPSNLTPNGGETFRTSGSGWSGTRLTTRWPATTPR